MFCICVRLKFDYGLSYMYQRARTYFVFCGLNHLIGFFLMNVIFVKMWVE